MKHYITRFIHYRDSAELGKTKITDKYNNLEQAGSVLSTILKEKLSQNWELNSFSTEEIADLQGNIITMVQGKNPSNILSVIWAIHPTPEPLTKGDPLFPDYIEIHNDESENNSENQTDVKFSQKSADHNKNYYLSAFIFQGYGQDDKTKIVEKYSTFKAAKNKLDIILDEKKSQNWKLDICTNDEIKKSEGNIMFMASAQQPDTINLITWAISTDTTLVTDGDVIFDEFKDITNEASSMSAREIAEQGFIPALIATMKMYPVISLGIVFFIFWLLFL